jgi:Nucleotidyl transferase AbiEii toxin, Type IV TA system
MALLRDEEGFDVAIGRAAQALGDLDPSFVEKDYWVTQVLRALHTEYPGGFLFKGGTSLSKGYNIIERFSEDVDILVVPLAGASIREGEAHLRAITGAVAAHLGLEWEEGRTPGRGREASRGDLIKYAHVVEAGVRVGIGPGSVLLETGYSGGYEPAEMVTIEPIMCRPLQVGSDEYEDGQPFQLRALEPRRTLIEKLFALHHVATLYLNGDVRDDERFGRHYYDVYKLLDHNPTTTKLARDRERFDDLASDVERLSRLHFGRTSTRPEGGFSASPAFAPDSQELRTWLEEKFNEALDLLPRQANRPTFGQVLHRIEQNAALL